MIDLKELERRLDEALARETESSLKEWLSSQRNGDISCYDDVSMIFDSSETFNIDQARFKMSFDNIKQRYIETDDSFTPFNFGFDDKYMEYSDTNKNLAAA
ncbi:hypothetical protein [Dysgonomonas macrotermitis]|uniref:Uncharacterized protein n=1 Tax=Dysgonomonas macrotermitis TaxID=1346286 RepID=A0A1M5JSH5_9BACT|nr:hypothetical protein [Dysgonomonas macrotermitis]SHG43494.1 hypothetical protein SAMN05444362_1282 [Dysgonomonas macrotermitis]